jgi:AcrR family transcriptional regulator
MEAERNESPEPSRARASRPGARRDLREDILEAATRLFAEQGYPKTSIRQVVEACGCTKPALYYYFSNKEELFKQAVKAERDAMADMLRDLAESRGTLRERLVAGTKRFVDHAEANKTKMQLLRRVDLQIDEQSPEMQAETLGARELHMHFLIAMFEKGIADGEIRGDVDPRDCAVTLAGTIDLQIQLWLQGESWSVEAIERTINLIFDGIAQR